MTSTSSSGELCAFTSIFTNPVKIAKFFANFANGGEPVRIKYFDNTESQVLLNSNAFSKCETEFISHKHLKISESDYNQRRGKYVDALGFLMKEVVLNRNSSINCSQEAEYRV
ncbi:hypothetical protein BDF20DRAFT_836003 [Mycotypha africana]|uniref:uncharacterized protein n=1 Tax=Mycotypha africana TaxID=64632 RepID=UPI0022FFE5B1|nr:uncharacterized protein BDF20DRAFT_836003 [Mycotypha africana]KAI8977180.1 hypothetical protein BDF20DRAFT_836003 [Mycotypha africana]